MFEMFKNLIQDIFGGIYDFSKIIILVDNIMVRSVMSLTIDFDSSGMSKVKGFNGDNGYNMEQDRGGVLKIKVSDCTMENKNLMDKNWGGTQSVNKNFNVRILDSNGGGTSYFFTGCQIMNRPNQDKKEQVSDLEYHIGFADFEVYCNGVSIATVQQLASLF